MVLSYSEGKDAIQAMPLKKGMLNLTAGTYKANLVYCVTDGNITLNWPDGTTTAVALVEGNTFVVSTTKNITLNLPSSTGKFHLA
jgi:hypothetical protein